MYCDEKFTVIKKHVSNYPDHSLLLHLFFIASHIRMNFKRFTYVAFLLVNLLIKIRKE